MGDPAYVRETNIHRRKALELVEEFEKFCTEHQRFIPTITHPLLTQAMIHAQLSTTMAVLAR